MKIVRAALIQDSPMVFDREATIEKVHRTRSERSLVPSMKKLALIQMQGIMVIGSRSH